MYPTVTLKQGKEKSILNKHHWLFSGALANEPAVADGSIVEIVSSDKKILGYGFLSTTSQIRVRVFHFGAATKPFDEAYWKQFIFQAHALRKELFDLSNTNMYRLFHAEGDFLSSLIIDVYDKVAVLNMLTKGIEQLRDVWVSALKELGFTHIYQKYKNSNSPIDKVDGTSGWIGDAYNSPILAKEHGILYEIDVVEGQKTGFFIDQRDNRALLSELSNGKKVLNTFSYSGGFSISALQGGAIEATSVDISGKAIELAQKNAEANGLAKKHTGIKADCFDFLRSAKSEWDIIVLDPPAFAKSAHTINQASRGYKDLNMLAIKKSKPNGLIFTFSCSQHISPELFQKIVFSAAIDAGRDVQILHRLSQGSDHPTNICHPEGEYLKGLVLRIV